jgi:nicotinamide mononucleotide transporter
MSAVRIHRAARVERALTFVGCLLAALLLYASWHRYVETDLTEALGFVTGAACVWLGVKQNIWNWPLGIANNIFYIIVFGEARLFADASLQVAFAVLGAYGWYAWLRRDARNAVLAVSRTPLPVWSGSAAFVVVATAGLAFYLARVNDAAPFLDALTTTLSLAAQYLMTRKYVECWLVWIAIDVISVGLYAFKHLDLTALLYALFLAMCIVGARSWKVALVAHERTSGRA